MDKKYYYLTREEYKLLELYDLGRFIQHIPTDPYDGWYEEVIPYEFIDDLARVVYSRKYKGANYDRLVALVERLQEVLEVNDHS